LDSSWFARNLPRAPNPQGEQGGAGRIEGQAQNTKQITTALFHEQGKPTKSCGEPQLRTYRFATRALPTKSPPFIKNLSSIAV
jgi:hypothetical protein